MIVAYQLIFVFVNPRKLQSNVYNRVTSFNVYSSFSEWVLIKTWISKIYLFLTEHC